LVYGSIVNVKPLVSVQADDDSCDDDLTFFLGRASAFVDSALRPYESSLPLVVVPVDIASIVEFYAAGLYLQRNSQEEKPHSYVGFAEGKLAEYIRAVYVQDEPRQGKVVVSRYAEISES
jgi:hypothetical protein